MDDQYTFEDREDQIRLREAWTHTLNRLSTSMPATALERFLRPLRPMGLNGDAAVFMAPGRFVYTWVTEKYIERLQDALSDELGTQIRFEVRYEAREKPTTPVTAPKVSSAPVAVETSRFVPDPRYVFDQFVVGQSNRMAFAGARAVATSPGTKYNPLFIYGPSGLGKTHLLHAIANEIVARNPGQTVMYVTAQQFTEEFVYALQHNRIDQFRRAHRNVSVWLFDDVQFISERDKTQEEVFHTFNYLQQSGKQVVLCADRSPRDLLLMSERLRSRFESNLVVDVQMPDTETRCAIILKKADRECVGIDHDTAMVLAETVPGTVRTLEGALTKLIAQASLDDVPITRDLAMAVVSAYFASSAPVRPNFEQIVGAVSRQFDIPVPEIKGESRKAPIAHARHVAVYVTREITKGSWKHIGHLFGDRDHTSMMHGYRKIRSMMDHDRELHVAVHNLIRDLFPDA